MVLFIPYLPLWCLFVHTTQIYYHWISFLFYFVHLSFVVSDYSRILYRLLFCVLIPGSFWWSGTCHFLGLYFYRVLSFLCFLVIFNICWMMIISMLLLYWCFGNFWPLSFPSFFFFFCFPCHILQRCNVVVVVLSLLFLLCLLDIISLLLIVVIFVSHLVPDPGICTCSLVSTSFLHYLHFHNQSSSTLCLCHILWCFLLGIILPISFLIFFPVGYFVFSSAIVCNLYFTTPLEVFCCFICNNLGAAVSSGTLGDELSSFVGGWKVVFFFFFFFLIPWYMNDDLVCREFKTILISSSATSSLSVDEVLVICMCFWEEFPISDHMLRVLDWFLSAVLCLV